MESVEITVCITCKWGPSAPFDATWRTGGEILAGALEAAADNQGEAARIIRHECLWACQQSCTVLIQAAGKTGYLAGRFEAGAAAADAIMSWAKAYARSAEGAVPYALWPDGIKGHFIARIPARGKG